MHSPHITVVDGSTISINKSGMKKNIIDDQMTYSNQFDSLFLKQRNYMISDDVKAIQNIPFKKESFVNVSLSEIDMTSNKQSKDQININHVQIGSNDSSNIEFKMLQHNTIDNNHNKIYQKKKSYITKDLVKNGDDQYIYSQDMLENNTNQYSPTGKTKKKYDNKSPEKTNTLRGTVMTERFNFIEMMHNQLLNIILNEFILG